MLLQLFFIVFWPHKDKLVLHCINNILMGFLGGMELKF